MSTTLVTDIELDRAHQLRVTYDDDVTCEFPMLTLRKACPCASCRGKRDAGSDAYSGASIEALDAKLHGNWGIAIRWSDGHDTGIYSWQLLRSWWDATTDAPGEPA